MAAGDGRCPACGYWHTPGHCIGLGHRVIDGLDFPRKGMDYLRVDAAPEPPIPWAEFHRDQRRRRIEQAVRDIPQGARHDLLHHTTAHGVASAEACPACRFIVRGIRARFAELAG